MGADYSFELKNIEIWVPAFFKHDNLAVATVSDTSQFKRENLYKPCNIEADAELASVPAISSATHKAQIEVPLCKPGKYCFFSSGLPCLLRTSAPYQAELTIILLRLRLAFATSSRNLNDSVIE